MLFLIMLFQDKSLLTESSNNTNILEGFCYIDSPVASKSLLPYEARSLHHHRALHAERDATVHLIFEMFIPRLTMLNPCWCFVGIVFLMLPVFFHACFPYVYHLAVLKRDLQINF